MAKKNLSTKEKLKRAKTRKQLGLAAKIVLPIIGLLIAIPLLYYTYIGVTFYFLPQFDYDQQKNVGAGYSHPLNAIPASDDNQYTLAYYYGDRWHVIDDDAVLKANRKNFIIYKKDDEWDEASRRQLFIMKNDGCMAHIPLSSFTLIYDKCFKDDEKIMTMEEFEHYVNEERGFYSVYIY